MCRGAPTPTRLLSLPRPCVAPVRLARPQNPTDTVRWVHDQDHIARHYLTSWCFIDAFSIAVSGFDFMSLNSFQVCGEETQALAAALAAEGGDFDVGTFTIFRVIRLARLVKLVRLVRSSRIMKRFESRTAINYGHLALFKCLVGLILVAHCKQPRRAAAHSPHRRTAPPSRRPPLPGRGF